MTDELPDTEWLENAIVDGLHSVYLAHDDAGNVIGHIGKLHEELVKTLSPLVAALRSERDDTRIANVRGDAWREQVKEDTLTIESLRAELERERTQNRERLDALAGLVEEIDSVREADLDRMFGSDESPAKAKLRSEIRANDEPALLAARAALSTQEESVQVHVRRDDGPDDTYLVRRASQEAPKA